MPQVPVAPTQLAATVDQLLPSLGLAYLLDDDRREWAVTRSTAGTGFESLQCGRRVMLTVEDHFRYCLVSSYVALS